MTYTGALVRLDQSFLPENYLVVLLRPYFHGALFKA